MLLNRHDYSMEDILIEKDDAFKVELGAKQVEEYILAVALVELRAHRGQLIEHWERL